MNMTQQKKETNKNSFDQVLEEISALHTKKDLDYGNAFGNTIQEFASNSIEMANGYALGSIKNKVNRLLTLMSGHEAQVDESIEDSLIDLASYAVMTLVELRNLRENGYDKEAFLTD